MKKEESLPISLSEAARLLAVSSRTVRRLVDQGHFTPVKVGFMLAIRVCDLPQAKGGQSKRDDVRPLMTVHDVAAQLTCSPSAVRELSARGDLRALDVGGSKRWSADEVEAFADRMSRDGR